MKTYEFFGALGVGTGAYLFTPDQPVFFTLGDWEIAPHDVAFFAAFLVTLGFGAVLRSRYRS